MRLQGDFQQADPEDDDYVATDEPPCNLIVLRERSYYDIKVEKANMKENANRSHIQPEPGSIPCGKNSDESRVKTDPTIVQPIITCPTTHNPPNRRRRMNKNQSHNSTR